VRLCSLAISTLVFLLFAPDAYSRTWYVKADSTGDAPTIRAAIDSAVAGDDVLVAPGTYTWTNQGGLGNYLIYMKSGIWLHSEMGPEVTILDGERHSWSVIFCSEINQSTVEGFTVTGGNNPGPCGYGGGGVYCGGCSNVTIVGNIITDNWATGVWEGMGGGGVYVSHGDSTTVIANNLIIDNYADYDGGGIGTWASPTIENNVICSNSTDGDGGGIYVYSPAAKIVGNTIVGNSGPEGSAIYVRTTPTISGNIICGSLGGPAVYCYADASPTITCNDFWNNEGGNGNCAMAASNFYEDPMFCDPMGDNYHLHEDSPCTPDESPSGCGLVGALPVGCWGAPLSPVLIALVIASVGAIGAWNVSIRTIDKSFR